MSSGGVLGVLGGFRWKWLRRFVLPLILGVVGLMAGVIWWKCLLMTIGFIGAFSLPYGEKTPYWLKFLVGCAFIAPTLLLGYSVWQVITPIVFIIMFKLSNTKLTANIFFWKAVEFISFGLVGVTVASLIK